MLVSSDDIGSADGSPDRNDERRRDKAPIARESIVTAKAPSAPRCAALVGPYLSGKTTLLESILAITGATARKGRVGEGNAVGDFAPEARSRQMGVEVNVATTTYLGESWTFLDCPGSIELFQESLNALGVVDTAVLVCEPGVDKALTVAPLLRFLDDRGIPHIVFINKMDGGDVSVKATLEALQAVSDRPLVLREIPIRDGQAVNGHVDLVSERAFKWSKAGASELIQLPESVRDREKVARAEMLEALADFDDVLLEALLEDAAPSSDAIYEMMAKDLRESLIVPVFFGSALNDNGVRRLLKALRHEAPEPTATAERLGFEPSGEPLARVFKTQHAAHTGKLSYARVWRGEIADGMTLNGVRVGSLSRTLGARHDKVAKAGVGEVVALGRLEGIATGALVSPSGKADAGQDDWPKPLSPLYTLALHAAERSDEVKFSGALARLMEEDPALSFEANPDTGELLIHGQGEVHLQIAIDRMKNRFKLSVTSEKPHVPYKETIRKAVSQHARHKKQSGGHGQFGDVHVDIKPLPRGSGFAFGNSVTGGAVPKQYIPAVEAGVRDYLRRGPLGFPVVDVAVTLTDGQFHAVDSSEMAFKTAGALAMREGMPKAGPVVLEPVFQVSIAVPSEFTSRIQRLASARRGHILGFDAKPGWKGWDEVRVQMPQAEMHDLINELRSITLGVGSFCSRFDHLQELTGREADHVIAERQGQIATA